MEFTFRRRSCHTAAMTVHPYQAETVFSRFSAMAKTRPSHVFLRILPEVARVYGCAAGDITYGDMARQVAARKAILAQRDLTGLRVGLFLFNTPDFFVNWLALNALGVSIVPINPDLKRREIEYILAHSEMAMMIAAPQAPQMLADTCQTLGLPMIGPHDRMDDMIGHMAVVADPADPAAGMDDAPASCREAALLYTSGTTGQPKGCQLDQVYFLAAGDWYADLSPPFDLRPGSEVMLTPLPMFHMNALAYSVMAMITTGGTLVPLDRFHPDGWTKAMTDSRATIVHYLGVMPSILMKRPADDGDRAHKVRFGFGAGVDRKLHADFEARFGFPLVEAWAMTETGAGVCIAATGTERHVGNNCFGTPTPDMQTRIVDDDGHDLPDGTAGELLVRRAGANPQFGFFRAYLKDPDATAAAWADGWFHTGDIVMRNGDGYFFFRDRKKNIIRRSGENIAALEVETVLMRHAGAAALAVGPVPDPLREQEVACLVVPAPGIRAEDLFDQLFALAEDDLAYFKAPGWFAVVDSLPLTGTQKLQRGALQTQLVQMLEGGQLHDFRHRKSRRNRAAG
ncbi:MAG: AMP-binding protein [Alphaproteobacteria bacterium]|nr:AMP-binding protein [Alphaproteobacteria bacterium]